MAHFITIPTTITGSPTILFNVKNLNYVGYLTTTTFVINSQTKSYTFTTSAAGALSAVNAIALAAYSISGPTLVNVVLPSGVTIAALPVIA